MVRSSWIILSMMPLEAGCNKVVFIIRKDIEEDFKEIIGKRIEKLVPVEYAYQSVDELPGDRRNTWGRTKPWGTGQAVLCVRNLVKEPVYCDQCG